MREVAYAWLTVSLITVVLFLFAYFNFSSEDARLLILIMAVVALIVNFVFMFAIGFYRYYLNEGSNIMEKEIVVAGGCFWGVEEYYKRLKGIIDTQVVYAQGVTDDPDYKQVCNGDTKYTEAVYLKYNPEQISLNDICDHLFRIIDPFSVDKQGNDVGNNYRTGIYYLDEADREAVEKFIRRQQKKYYSRIVVEVEKLDRVYDAEEYHQDYLEKNVNGYCHVDFSKMKDKEKKAEYL